MTEDSQKELIFKFQIFEQQINAINQQLQAIEKALTDMNSISMGLDEVKVSVGKEILAQVGNGIFTRARLESDELMIDVGERNFVKKSIPETKKLIAGQMEKLEDTKDKLNQELNEINKELTKTMMEYESNSKKCSCKDGGECTCNKDECECEDN